MRRQFVLRDAGPEDAAALVGLWRDAGNGVEQATLSVEDAERALGHLAGAADHRLVVSEDEGRIVAALSMARAPISPLHAEDVVHTSYLLVLPEYRRHGHARALLETAVAWAEEKDVHHVSAITTSASRDTNRFLARLGLGTVAHVRIAATPTLRKKLSPPSRAGSGRSVGQVLAARRSLRRRREDQDD